MTMKTQTLSQRTFNDFLVSLYIMQDWLFHQLYYVKEDFADQIKKDELLEILQIILNFESHILQIFRHFFKISNLSDSESDFVAKSSLLGRTLSHHFNFID